MTLFDESGRLIDPDALRSVQFNGRGVRVPAQTIVDGNKVTELVHDDDGGTAGYLTEHGSGRVDANVHARAATTNTGAA